MCTAGCHHEALSGDGMVCTLCRTSLAYCGAMSASALMNTDQHMHWHRLSWHDHDAVVYLLQAGGVGEAPKVSSGRRYHTHTHVHAIKHYVWQVLARHSRGCVIPAAMALTNLGCWCFVALLLCRHLQVHPKMCGVSCPESSCISCTPWATNSHYLQQQTALQPPVPAIARTISDTTATSVT